MKKKLVVLSLSVATLFNGVAFGLDFDPKFYVGGEAQVNHSKGTKDGNLGNTSRTSLLGAKNKSILDSTRPGAGLFVGSRLTENLGVEVGASAANHKVKNGNLSTGLQTSSLKAKNTNLYADVMGILPVSNEVELLASVGVGRLSTKMNGKVNGTALAAAQNVSLKSSKAGVRVGAGVQYKFDENLGARLMVRHQKGNKLIKNVTSAGLGLFYQF